MERATGFEPATLGLGSRCASTKAAWGVAPVEACYRPATGRVMKARAREESRIIVDGEADADRITLWPSTHVLSVSRGR